MVGWAAPIGGGAGPMASLLAPPSDDAERGATLDEVERFLREAVASLEPAPAARRGRPPILPSLCLWAGLLVCVLRGFDSHLSLWRLLSGRGLWDFPRVAISDQAVYHRLARDGTAPLERLFLQPDTRVALRQLARRLVQRDLRRQRAMHLRYRARSAGGAAAESRE